MSDMKHPLLLFAAVALTLAACSNDDENLNGGPVELRLSSSLEVQTRAYQVQDEQLARGKPSMYGQTNKTVRPTTSKRGN